MRKVYMVCSLLLAFGASMFGLGCDGGKAPDPKKSTGTLPIMTGPAPKLDDKSADASKADAPKTDGATDDKKVTPKKVTARKPKSSGTGSTTGGGVEVPTDPAGGTTEKPKSADKPDDKPKEATPEAKPDAKPEDKTETKADEKKPE